MTLVDNRFLAAIDGDDLAIYDLDDAASLRVRIGNVVNYAFQPDCLIVSDEEGGLQRWERSDKDWRMVSPLERPAVSGAESSRWSRMVLSRSGRFLLVESAPIPTGPKTWSVSDAFLLDAGSGQVLRTFHLGITYVRANFETLPNHDEILFISADSYMSVQMVDCASGSTLHEYVFQKPSDFCHTDYALAADASRLVTFGCIWAAPFEPIIYDVTPWTGNASANEGFPLPIVYWQVEAGYGDSALPIAVTETDDGNLTGLTTVTMKYLPEYGSADDLLIRKGMKTVDEEIYDHLRRMPPCDMAIVIRRIDPATGDVVGWSASAINPTDERHIHTLSNHRVVLVNDRIQLLDGYTGVVTDIEARDERVDERTMTTIAGTDGKHLVIWSPESVNPKDGAA